jgi:hypothetical protein
MPPIHFMLPVAYNYGDLGQVYPIARGSAPLLVTAGAFVFAGETLGFIPLLGVICLAVGVMALSFDRGTGITKNPRSVLFALATSACIASYTMVDGLGARQTSSAMSFAIWLTIGDGLLSFLIALPWKRQAIVNVARAGLVLPGIAAVMQVGAYWIAVRGLGARAPGHGVGVAGDQRAVCRRHFRPDPEGGAGRVAVHLGRPGRMRNCPDPH